MLAVLPHSQGQPELGELPDPLPAAGEVLVAVAATAINRADLYQLAGSYPPPPGESEIPGLECSGRIVALGEGVETWHPGQLVMALLAGGGHAQKVAVPVGQLMPVPGNLSLLQAAALPEAALTAWTNLVVEGELQAGQTVLITGAASGVGTFAVQLARELGAQVLVAGRDRARLEALCPLGASATVLLGPDMTAEVRQLTGGRGADLVLDLIGGEHVPRCLGALAERGRLVLVGTLAGSKVELALSAILRHRLRIIGSVLRSRSRAEKAELIAGFADFALPLLADGRLKPVVDRVLPFADIAAAYQAMAEGGVLGKIVVEV